MDSLMEGINKLLKDSLEQKTKILEEKEAEIAVFQQMWSSGNVSFVDSDFLVMSSEMDKESTDIISQHFAEFGELAHKYGFKLVTKYHYKRNYGIYLSQLRNNVNLNETVKLIEQLVEKILAERITNKYPRTTLPEARKSYRLIEKEFGNLHKDAETYQKKSEKVLEDVNNVINQHIIKMEKRKQDVRRENQQKLSTKFFQSITMEGLKKSPYIMSTLCERTSTRKDNKKPPLMGLSSEEDKLQQLNSYMDFIQSSENSCEMHKNIEEWLCNSWKHLVFSPSIDKLSHIQHDVMMTKYLLDHDVIATLHFVTLPQNIANSKCLALVIIDQRIAYRFCKQKQDSLQNFYKTVRRDPHWPVNKKIATNEPVDDKHKQLFVYNDNEEIYENNDKVVRWIENNFKRLQHVCEGTFLNSIPSMYNLLFYLFVDGQQ